MRCNGCSSGRGCSTASNSLPGGCKNNGGCNKLNVFDWLGNMELPAGQPVFDCVEVRFKNSRKEIFRNVNNLQLNVGDVVAIEASPGHDIGVVSISGELTRLQMKKKGLILSSEEIKKIYRKAKASDIDKWREAQNMEHSTMYRARTIAVRLKLQMKISDVEYQGDKTKAIFYYTAEERVDFRELIKVLADEFRVRIEMKQIGARQEAGRLGGIASCGRELCCATWLTDFRSVSTTAARYQQLSLNPVKLAGQCGKLKCCLNYELDSYLDAIRDFPDVTNLKLETEGGRAFHQKTDIFKRIMFFSYTDEPDNFIPLSVDRVKEIMEMNANGSKPAELLIKVTTKLAEKKHDYENVVGQDSLTRFDKGKKQKNQKKRNVPPNTNRPAGGANTNKPTTNKPNIIPNNPKPADSTDSPDSTANKAQNNSGRQRQKNNRPRPNKSNNPPTQEKPAPKP